jgi:T5SS/PEP-CTERM-associated repeat protein
LVFNGCPIEYSGSAQVFSTSATAPSLHILQGGQLRLASGASLESVHTFVGLSGATDSKLEVKGGSWTNSASTTIGRGSVDVLNGGTASTGALSIGSGNGPGSVHVTGDASSFEVTDVFVVGDTTAGTLEIDRGLFSLTQLTTTPLIGRSAPGTVTVRGDDSSFSSYGRFQVDRSLIVGNGSSGRLRIERGGHASIALDLVVSEGGANPAGEVVVDGQGGINTLNVEGGTFVNATELQEIFVQNGGRLSTNDLFIGGLQIRPGTADVTLRGASGSFPALTVGTPGGPGVGTFIGDGAPGQLNVEAGASAELYNGLYVGHVTQGIVSVSGLNHPPGILSTLTVTGETRVGIGAPGIVQLDAVAQMENNGDMKIGLGGGNPSGSVNLADGSYLRVNGVLSVGTSGIGLLNVLSGSGVRCDTLLVGGDTFGATGIIVQAFFSYLTVDENAQVGVGTGRGEILLADPEARLAINGTMTIGNPNGGPGGGAVALVDARIEGTGRIVVNKNGSLTGTGTVAALHVDAGGIIRITPTGAPSPNVAAPMTANADGHIAALVSPRTLTIEGDYEQLPTGVLVLEYAGRNLGEFDVLHVTGQTTLAGRLEVHFRNGFSPPDPGAFIQSQDFVEGDGAITGDYDERIYAFPDLFADFDDDGDKDLRDVASFQNCFGLSGSAVEPACSRADWEDNDLIDGIDVAELIPRLTNPQ